MEVGARFQSSLGNRKGKFDHFNPIRLQSIVVNQEAEIKQVRIALGQKLLHSSYRRSTMIYGAVIRANNSVQ